MVAFAGRIQQPFVRYWVSGFLADFGDGVRLAAFPLLAAGLTRSPAAIAAVTAVQTLPWLLLGVGLGVIADRAGALGIAVLLLLTLPGVFGPVSESLTEPDRREPGMSLAVLRHDVVQGLKWVRRNPVIRDLTIAVDVICAMDAAWFAVLVLYVVQVLHQKAGIYGLLLAAGAIGGVAVGGIGPRISRRLGAWGCMLLAGLVMAAAQAGLGLTSNVVVAAVMLAASSAAFALSGMTAVTMRQRQVPDNLLGRVTSIYLTVARGTEALGALAGGVLAAVIGIRATMIIGAGPIAAVTILLTWRHRKDRVEPA